MELQQIQGNRSQDLSDKAGLGIDKQANRTDKWRQCTRNSTCSIDIDRTRARCVKDQPDRIRAKTSRLDSCSNVAQTAYFYALNHSVTPSYNAE